MFIEDVPYTVTDNDAQLEDNVCLLKVSGRVVIRSLTSSSILHDLEDQKVTLTGVVCKHKEQDLKKSLKVEINNLETKRQMIVRSSLLSSQTIITINEDMDKVISKYRDCKDTAFAHCVSADTWHERNMSAGVAVLFKHHFGKPLASEFLNNYLAYQNSGEEDAGAGVYSLVTKKKYFHKPSRERYEKAFKYLMCDFKKRGFKRLICSPMGCVRDHITIELFALEIVLFQRHTEAKVYIVTYNEQQKRLYGGLPHSEFVKELNRQIITHDSLMLKLELTNLNVS